MQLGVFSKVWVSLSLLVKGHVLVFLKPFSKR